MSTKDIHDQLQDLYGIELSAEMVSKITDKILPEVREWQSRPLNPVYPFVFMDCIHYKVREDGRILSHAAYVVLGVTAEGYKEMVYGFFYIHSDFIGGIPFPCAADCSGAPHLFETKN